MQDETQMGSNPRGYAGGKWKRQTSSEDAKTALNAASVTIKDRARGVAEQQKQAGADQIGGVARAIYGAAHEIEQEMPHAAGFVHDAAARLEGAGVDFVIAPTVRFEGQPGEQATMFLLDPAGNALEFKAMAKPENLFAKD